MVFFAGVSLGSFPGEAPSLVPFVCLVPEPRDDTIYFSTLYDSCHQAHPLCGDTVFVYTTTINTPELLAECCPGEIFLNCCRSDGCLPDPLRSPRWFFIRIATPGKIQILVTFQRLYSNGLWITFCPDFLVYGPFYSPTEPCVAGLVDSTVVDCHIYTANVPDTINIPWGNTGTFYLIALHSWTYGADIMYSKLQLLHDGEPGYGTLDCNMALNCTILSVTAQPSSCDPQSNSFTLSGKVYFIFPPQTGNLVVWDNNTGYSVNIPGPFVSPVNYSIPGIPCDNALHTVTAMFWDSASCNLSTQYQAPVLCPDALISGGGEICAGSSAYAPVLISVNPLVQMPVTLQWSVNGVSQPWVTTSGPFPYMIQATEPGVYTLDTAYNAQCAGDVQGQALVSVWPHPTPDLGPDITRCEGDEVTLDAGPGYQSYIWSTGDNTQNITVNKPDLYSVTVTDSHGCMASDSIQVNFENKPGTIQIKHQ